MRQRLFEDWELPDWYRKWEKLPTEKRIEDMEKRREKIVKLIPSIIDFFKLKYGDRLHGISLREKGVHYAHESHSMDVPVLIFHFNYNKKTPIQNSSGISREISSDIDNFFNIPIEFYGIPLDFEISWREKPSMKESVNPSIKRRGIEIFRASRETYPYLYPCEYDRDTYIQSILSQFEDITMGYNTELENMDVGEVTQFLKHMYGDHFLYHWDKNCGENPLNESKEKVSVEKYLDRTLTKLFDSNIIKSIYPMVNKIEVYRVDDMDRLIVKIYVSDPEITKDNMYKMGLDPHYLIDFHMNKFFPYVGEPKDKKVGFVVVGPDDKVIDGFLA